MLTMLAGGGLIFSPILASCSTASKVNGSVSGGVIVTLALLGFGNPWARSTMRSMALGLCVAALRTPRALAPWSYDLFAISVFAGSFSAG